MPHRQMRNNSGEIVRAVAAGESVQVTNNGQVAAVISPPPTDPFPELSARGQVRQARRPLSDLALVRRRTSSIASAELIDDVRGRW